MSATMSVLVGQVTELLSMCEALLAVTALSRIVLIVLQVAFFEVVLVVASSATKGGLGPNVFGAPMFSDA